MANLVITTSTNTIKINLNDTPAGDITKWSWRKDKIVSFALHADYIIVSTFHESFRVSNTATDGCLVIDSIDGSAPSNLSDLYDKLTAMLG